MNRAAMARWTSRIALGLLLVLAFGFVALRVVVARVPAYAAEMRNWVQQQTRLELDFDSLDAGLRWYGPEIVLRDAKLLEPVDHQPLLAVDEARVALDLWNFFRTGELVAGRLRLVGPEVVIVRLPDGRIRLLNQLERPADRPPFDLDSLPAGRVEIVDASVEFRDLLKRREPLRLTDLDLRLVRRQDAVQVTGGATLPDELGSDVEFAAQISGSMMEPESLQGQVDATVDHASLPGWGRLLPEGLARIDDGRGELEARVVFAGGRVDQLRLDLDSHDVALRLPSRRLPGIETVMLSKPHRQHGESPLRMPAVQTTFVTRPAEQPPATAAFARLAGKFRLRREDGGLAFRIAEIEAVPVGARRGQALGAAGDVGGFFRGDLRTTYALRVDARNLRLGELWPLAVAFAPPSADRWLGLAPSGEVHSLSLDASRPRAGAIPAFRISADVQDLSLHPSGRTPGFQRLTATLSGTDARGRIALRSQHAAFQWPRMFTAPLAAERLSGDFDWVREGREWRIEGRDLRLERPGLATHGQMELSFVSAARSPRLVLDLGVESVDVRLVPEFLPAGRLKERSLAWLSSAFVAGRADGHLTLSGPIRKFPFRHGEGEFQATAVVRDATLDYFPGFTPLADASGTVRFHNAALEAELRSGKVGQLAVKQGKIRIADLKNPTLEVSAAADGDVGEALGFLQGSPLAGNLGKLFSQLSGRGPADYAVDLTLPLREPQRRDYRVATTFHRVRASVPALRAPVVDLEGTLELHNLEARASDLRGSLLDGPFAATVAPGDDSGGGPAVEVRATGRADGARLPDFIGLPSGIAMQGFTPWNLTLRAERVARDAPWTTRIAVASNLAGLTIDAPRPFAKSAAETRDTEVRLQLGPADRNDVQVESGGARAQLSFLVRDGRWQLERGLARFDGGPMPRTFRDGLQIVGEWPEFDLGEWLALAPGTPGRGALSEWLGRVDVHLENARVFGFELRDVDAQLTDDGDNWLVDLQCPVAEGRVTVPVDLRASRPIVLDLRRLYLQSAAGQTGDGVASRAPVDPRKVQPFDVTIDDFAWNGRRFGRLVASVRRTADGLELASLRTQSPAFSIVGTGRWVVAETGTRTSLDVEFDSTDLASASEALGYRKSIEAEHAHARASLQWSGGPSGNVLSRLDGSVHLDLGRGRLLNVEPGAAGRVLGLMSVVELPRRLSLDFRDVTDEGLAFDSVRGDFALRGGNAYTDNLLLKGAAVDIGIAGRTGLASQDYDQTVVVSGNPSGPLTVAGALAAGPVVGAGVLVLSQLFKGQLQGLTRAYYRITGPWASPDVQRVSAATSEGLAQETSVTSGASR